MAVASVAALLARGPSGTVLATAAGALALGLVGFLDDRLSLPATPRLAAQVAVPTASIVSLCLFCSTLNIRGIALSAILIAWCAGYTNAFNFMDGANGVSAAQAVVGGVAIAELAERAGADPSLKAASYALAGSAAGFAFHNLRGRIFLGDVGSYFLGYWLAALGALAVANGVPIESVGPIFMLYIADTTITLGRRWRSGERLLEPHREHAYQRLLTAGWTHTQVAIAVAATIAISSAISVQLYEQGPIARTVGLAAAAVLALGFVSVATRLEARSFER